MAANGEGSGNSAAEAAVPIGWQAQKSASTRTQIIEAAVKCLVDLGYARTTTAVIAEKAGLSRGAMLHHFPSKMDIVRAAFDSLHANRLRAFRKAMARKPAGVNHFRLESKAIGRT